MRGIRLKVIASGALLGGVLGAAFAPRMSAALLEFTAGLLKRTMPPELVRQSSHAPIQIPAMMLLGILVGAGVPTLILGSISRWERLDAGDRITSVLGIVAGLLVSSPILLLLSALQVDFLPFVIPILMIAMSVLGVYTLSSIKDSLPWYKNTVAKSKTGIKILDTNVIIDGRIHDIIESGFLEGPLYVSQWVVEELQHIADSPDALRRQRGKRGLDVLRLLQDKFKLEVGTKDHLAQEGSREVDSRLVRLARALGGDLVTNDMNLNQVASLQHVRVLNINDLAMALKPNILPREMLELPIVKEGNQWEQGVGYLDDGTMVVVEHGKAYIGQTMPVRVTQVIQTERGKMIFAEVPTDEGPEPRAKSRHGR